MTVYGLFNDGADVLDAGMLRQLVTLLTESGNASHGLNVAGGVRITGGYVDALKVSPGVSGLTVTANTGLCVVPAATTGGGGYTVVNDAVKTITLATADGSQARIDRIVAQVTDTGDETSTYDIIPVTGTPAGSPAAPATPSNALSLATVLVAAGASTPAGLTVTDTRTRLNPPFRIYGGISMGREEVPTATTTSGSFATLWFGRTRRRQDSINVTYLANTPSGSTAEFRLTANSVLVGSTVAATGPAFAYGDISGTLPGGHNDVIDLRLQARLVTGASAVGITFISGFSF